MATSCHLSSVIIVGAGPSGLLLALLLASLDPRPNITILDAAPTLNEAPRATHYGPPAIQLFRKAGILAEVRRDGYMPVSFCWRKLDGERIAGFDRGLMHDDGLEGDGLTVFWVGRLCALLERELKRRAGLRVQWGSKMVAIREGLGAGDSQGTVEVEDVDGHPKTWTADYVVGCDGGNSTVRQLMFGKRNFPGFSWEEQIVATNTMYDFDQFGWDDTNFVIDPVDWYMAARIQAHADPKQNIWRVSYGEISGLSDEELLERQAMKFRKMLPGHPEPHQYTVTSKSPYRVHQRCVENMREGRVMLAADAAHLCNPFGGLGLTGGIVDVGGLFQCLEGIHAGVADNWILDVWSRVQRQKWHEIINPVSSANIRRLFDKDPDNVLERDKTLQLYKQAETDPGFSRELQSAGNALLYDYTQHYISPLQDEAVTLMFR